MIVGKCLLDLRLYGVGSLKEKRRIVKSLTDRLKLRFGVSCAEVGENDTWQRALIGIAYVSSTGRHAEEVLRRAVSWVEASFEGEILSSDIEIVS